VSEVLPTKVLSLHDYRQQFGYSQRKLATVLGCSERTIQRLEAGGVPDFVTAVKLELLYRVPLHQLFADAYARIRHAFQPSAVSADESLGKPDEEWSALASDVLAIEPSSKLSASPSSPA